MNSNLKKWINKHINAYFVFVALAFTIGAYVFFMDNSATFVVKSDVLIVAKNEKTALNLDRIKENLVALAKKNDIVGSEVGLNMDKRNSLVEFEVEESTQVKASEKSDLMTRNFIDYANKYYDAQNDVSLEVASKQVFKKEIGRLYILAISISIGLVLSLLIQTFLDLVESVIRGSILGGQKPKRERQVRSKDLENVLRMNSEKIRKLSSSQPMEERVRQVDVEVKSTIPKRENRETIYSNAAEVIQPVFKKASSPINLPIADEDLVAVNNEIQDVPVGVPFIDEDAVRNLEERVFGSISHANHSHDVVFAKDNTFLENEIVERELSDDIIGEQNRPLSEPISEAPKKVSEPTEEDFKRKLNQLLGNR